jgi:hypothetical protein
MSTGKKGRVSQLGTFENPIILIMVSLQVGPG